MKQKNRVLSRAQAFQVADWLRSQIGVFSEEHPTYRDVAKQATSALGFSVSPSSISSIAADLGLAWTRKSPKSPKVDRIGILAGIVMEIGEVLECLSHTQVSDLKALKERRGMATRGEEGQGCG